MTMFCEENEWGESPASGVVVPLVPHVSDGQDLAYLMYTRSISGSALTSQDVSTLLNSERWFLDNAIRRLRSILALQAYELSARGPVAHLVFAPVQPLRGGDDPDSYTELLVFSDFLAEIRRQLLVELRSHLSAGTSQWLDPNVKFHTMPQEGEWVSPSDTGWHPLETPGVESPGRLQGRVYRTGLYKPWEAEVKAA